MNETEKLTKEQCKLKEDELEISKKSQKLDAKAQDKEYKALIKQKSNLVQRTKHDVRDDVKYGVLPKSALIIEPLHKIGIPTGAITSGVIAFGDMSAFLTMSDKKLCDYYAHYDEVVKAKKQSVSSIVKAVDKQDEAVMSAKADLSASKLRYTSAQNKIKLNEAQLKLQERAMKINQAAGSTVQGQTADSFEYES